MKKRFYLITLVFSTVAYLSQAKAAMPDDDAQPEETTDTIVPVAIVNGETPYASLNLAFYSATDTTVNNIQLVDDVNMGLIVLKKGLTVSLDLNGHQITIDSLGIYNYGTLIITDSSQEGNGSLNLDHGNVSMMYNYGELTITGGKFQCTSQDVGATDSRRCLITFAGSDTNIQGGTFVSTGQALCFAGKAVINAGEFATTGNCEVVANYSNEQLVINGGTFTTLSDNPDGNDIRRCLWTSAGSNTLIQGGTFTSGKHVLYLLGSATIEDGNFTSQGNGFVVGNMDVKGDVVINGGTFMNTGSKPVEGSDQRNCIISYQNTRTAIGGGKFISPYQTAVFNGNATISDGDFVTTGNINVVGNFNVSGELVISGGTFTNEGEQPEYSLEADNRRCLWANNNTTTIITGGTFTTSSTAQTITIYYGKATVSGGTFTNNGHGSGIATNGTVEITGCRIKAWNMLICWEGGTMACSGGFFSEPIPTALLADECQCVENNDSSTKDIYPYRVVKGTPGDVNGDGAVNVADISAVISVMAGTESEEIVKAADVNGDGAVNVADIASIISIMAGA